MSSSWSRYGDRSCIVRADWRGAASRGGSANDAVMLNEGSAGAGSAGTGWVGSAGRAGWMGLAVGRQGRLDGLGRKGRMDGLCSKKVYVHGFINRQAHGLYYWASYSNVE